MSTSSVFIYENFPEAHRHSFGCFSYSCVVCSSKLKRMIWVLNIGILKNTLFLALMVANVIFFFKFMAPLTPITLKIMKTKRELSVCCSESVDW